MIESQPGVQLQEEPLGGKHWRWSLLTSLANYIDAGSIVAGGTGLALWQSLFHMSNNAVGLLAAFSSNAISCGVGALIGGRLGDRLGRKRIYSYDLLVYCFGLLWIIFALNAWMLTVGYVIVGLAVGADVPTSWSLIAEFSPANARGKLMALTDVLWYVGPIVTLAIALALSSMGLLGVRLVFVHLLIVALVTWFLRRKLVESPRWAAQVASTSGTAAWRETRERSRLRDLFRGKNLFNLVWLSFAYSLWNIPAGTFGFFLPYIIETTRARGNAVTGDLIDGVWFVSAIVAVLAIFMPLNDRVSRKLLYGVSALGQTLAFAMLGSLPLAGMTLLISAVFLYGFTQGIGQWPLLAIWSVELFPTMLRNTALGICFSSIRFTVGIWSFFVPLVLARTGLHGLAWILFGMMAGTLILGVVFGPETGGLTLEQIQGPQTEGTT